MKVLKITEAYFGTEQDPDQMPVTSESKDKLESIHPDTVIYKFDEKGEPIGWVVALPTSVESMNGFLSGKITERELLDRAAEEKSFESLYLCSVFVVPEHRKRGLAKELFREAISKLAPDPKTPLYAWIYSPEGEKLIESLSRELGRPIVTKK